MPRDSSGNYTLPQAPFVANTLAKALEVNANFSDIAAALTDSESRSNPEPRQGDLNMNGNDITNVGQVQGDLVVLGNISAGSGHNVSATNAVIADHVLAFRTGTYGGAVGSWETGTGRGAGMRLNAPTSTLEFGTMDPATGNMTAVAASLTSAGALSANTVTAGTITATGTVSGATVSSSGNITATGTIATSGNIGASGNLNIGGLGDITGKLVLHQGLRLSSLGHYNDNAAALAGGLTTGDVYFNNNVGGLSIVL